MSNQELKVSLDGGVTFQPAPNGVRVIYPNVEVPGEDAPGELHVNLNSEGIVSDIWVSREQSLDHNIATESISMDIIIGDLIDEGM